ncbi:hypothetical protein [Pararobbsia alpina]|nr:hypothetical protein [Pararobbsia alpina]
MNDKTPLKDHSRKYLTLIVPSRTVMRLRGMLKVILASIIANEILMTAFLYLAGMIDPNVPHRVVSVFSFVTCFLVGSWLQSDARRAYSMAREKGLIAPVDDTHRSLGITADCPKRWLVILHIELNPAAVGL